MKNIAIISICILSYFSFVRSATTRRPDVAASVLTPELSNSQQKLSADDVILSSLSSPDDSKPTGLFTEGVVIEPVPADINMGINLPSDNNVQIPVFIKDDNLVIKPVQNKETTTPEIILIRDDNLMVTPGSNANTNEEQNNSNSVMGNATSTEGPIPEPSASTDSNIQETTIKELVTPTTPIPVTENGSVNTMKPTENAAVGLPDQPLMSPCPDFESRYEEGSFVVKLDDGKCEMVVSEQTVEHNQGNQWAAGRYTPIYSLLSREYKPAVTFRSTALTPGGHDCQHRTRKTGNFFVVDTIKGKCQMVIGIPALPDLRYIMSQREQIRPRWNQPVRRMPMWPRPSSDGEESDD